MVNYNRNDYIEECNYHLVSLKNIIAEYKTKDITSKDFTLLISEVKIVLKEMLDLTINTKLSYATSSEFDVIELRLREVYENLAITEIKGNVNPQKSMGLLKSDINDLIVTYQIYSKNSEYIFIGEHKEVDIEQAVTIFIKDNKIIWSPLPTIKDTTGIYINFTFDINVCIDSIIEPLGEYKIRMYFDNIKYDFESKYTLLRNLIIKVMRSRIISNKTNSEALSVLCSGIINKEQYLVNMEIDLLRDGVLRNF